MDDIYVRIIKLPFTIRGVTVMDENGDFNVYINSVLSSDQQRLVLKHEMKHINRNDFERFADIFEIEDIDP